ncbi:MAG TPA: methyltransferase domain-containing protein [Fuerstia sp.]|nr:methyltransferase domain-containing protein [Fuerstiella sp.]
MHETSFTFETQPDLFSPRKVDAGTLAMLKSAQLSPGDKLLDLGCGYGVVGIYAAKILGDSSVSMLDSNPTAIQCAQNNADLNNVPGVSISLSDGFRDFHEIGFTRILCNPPYHTDFAVAKHFILKGFNRLVIGGEFWFVTKRDKWYGNKLRSIFGFVDSRNVDSYFVLRAVKKQQSFAARKKGR